MLLKILGGIKMRNMFSPDQNKKPYNELMGPVCAACDGTCDGDCGGSCHFYCDARCRDSCSASCHGSCRGSVLF